MIEIIVVNLEKKYRFLFNFNYFILDYYQFVKI